MSWLSRALDRLLGEAPTPRHGLDSLDVPPPEMSRPAPTPPPTFPPPEGYEWRVVRPFANMFLLTHSACGVVVADAQRHNETCGAGDGP